MKKVISKDQFIVSSFLRGSSVSEITENKMFTRKQVEDSVRLAFIQNVQVLSRDIQILKATLHHVLNTEGQLFISCNLHNPDLPIIPS